MKYLGIDPGATVGFCIYENGKVLSFGEIAAEDNDASDRLVALIEGHEGPIAIERTRVFSGRGADGVIKHAAGNDVADSCEQTGWLCAVANGRTGARKDLLHGAWHCGGRCYLLERRAVIWQIHRHFGQQIKGDAAVWQAMLLEHGGKDAMQGPKQGKRATRKSAAIPDRPAGHLHGMGNHARAAFATAWALQQFLETT